MVASGVRRAHVGAVFSSLDACDERSDLARESGFVLETLLVTRARRSAARTSAQCWQFLGRRLQLINAAMRAAAGKSSVGRSVRLALDTHTSASIRCFDGVSGIVTEYDVGTDTCTVDVGAMTSTANLDDLDARLAQLQVLQTHGVNS